MTERSKTSTRSDLAWGIGAQFMQYGAALLLLPVLAASVSSADLGLWFVFMTIQSLVLLLDLGFGNSLARTFSYIFAGATRLLRHGVHDGEVSEQTDPMLLATTIRTAQVIYGLVAGVVALLLAVPGTIYIASLGALSAPSGIAAWTLYALAVVLNIYFQWYLPLLVGAGKVRESYKATVIVRGGFALGAGVLLHFKPSLWVVSLAYFGAALVMLLYVARKASAIFAGLPSQRINRAEIIAKFRVLWHNSYRTGLVSLGAFLITKYSVLLVSSHYGLTISGRYAITLQVFSAISSLSLVPFGAMLPKIAARLVRSDDAGLKQLLGSAFALTWALSLGSIAFVLLFGHTMLAALHTKTDLLGSNLLALVAVTAFLELNHGAAAMVIAATNRVPFVPAALISGAVICALSTIAAWRNYPLWTIIAIQSLTQLAYNNWRWPLLVFREYRFSRSDFTSSLRLLVRHGETS